MPRSNSSSARCSTDLCRSKPLFPSRRQTFPASRNSSAVTSRKRSKPASMRSAIICRRSLMPACRSSPRRPKRRRASTRIRWWITFTRRPITPLSARFASARTANGRSPGSFRCSTRRSMETAWSSSSGPGPRSFCFRRPTSQESSSTRYLSHEGGIERARHGSCQINERTFVMAETATLSRFEVIFDAEGINTSKFRNDVKVHLRGPYAVSYELPTDEGGIHGGDGSAPYALAYFTSALTACVMTQIRAFSKRLGIPVDGFTVKTRCHWQAQQNGNAPYESAPVAFTMDVDIESDASEADKRRLLAAAQKGCFVEQSLKPGLVRHRLKIGERWVDA